jgi:hypothetical protein
MNPYAQFPKDKAARNVRDLFIVGTTPLFQSHKYKGRKRLAINHL